MKNVSVLDVEGTTNPAANPELGEEDKASLGSF